MIRALMLLTLLLAAPLQAAIDLYQFDDNAQQDRFHRLTEELRCPKCQNQSIADSDAEIARDMRERVARMIREGRSNEEIVQFFVARYGDFVSYRPPVNERTAILWVGPVALLILGGLGILLLARRASRRVEEDDAE
ncbi:cytochrome c-type biogenesis protein [Alloalcanivorax profundimaris]|uniref:Cytochrome c-type biogenesis protein n=1 Tax=Alloalcanivorax profundimaris TaxID=2735259 RepID=A0ABS0AQ78_9GAMM|nr:cytochrome c-type biogenesis protein [Alloalcanivorax profundimaris]MBM1142933.1 cytochrome c-type biogenesis protein CcmH [Alcanivorax sp. ZXX171]MCQ6263281.1 cytochrome c-type biogenesis protein CcmH [Alcanivorax sp. MM125-6]QJX03175.1 cytochrome c-type biogenesis protein CcmH [Alcanivorax sp. IO_7]MBF1801302.1 cytochrome c-type biogenesis protein CcmH [Alloalcanivorax profundimaris]MBF5056258.1 cytochrome c-type biogenesis protein CycL [Alloalcanivorax profundimaris]